MAPSNIDVEMVVSESEEVETMGHVADFAKILFGRLNSTEKICKEANGVGVALLEFLTVSGLVGRRVGSPFREVDVPLPINIDVNMRDVTAQHVPLSYQTNITICHVTC